MNRQEPTAPQQSAGAIEHHDLQLGVGWNCRQNHAGAIAHVVTMLRAQEEGWHKWFVEEGITPMEVPYPVLWRNLTQVVGTILETLGLDPGLAPQPVLERQADQRSDEWVERYRADAEKNGLPT